ncbi:MAG: hypothetical protein KBD24_02590 [Candidatus Pacebacteria bacterium]|nr:hypothetical protein [Candidatus Paceibacterota bacterium]
MLVTELEDVLALPLRNSDDEDSGFDFDDDDDDDDTVDEIDEPLADDVEDPLAGEDLLADDDLVPGAIPGIDIDEDDPEDIDEEE